MNLSSQGLDLIKQRERCVLTAYRDSREVLTIGYGDTNNVHEGMRITQDEADERLANRLREFEDAVTDAVTVDLSQNQYDALVSFAYNVGAGAFSSSTLVKLINANDMSGAANQFDRWHIPPEITSRRNGEKAQFMGTDFEPRL